MRVRQVALGNFLSPGRRGETMSVSRMAPNSSSMRLMLIDSPLRASSRCSTRDTRDVARATRFCHRFEARLAPGPSKPSQITT